MDKKLIVVRNYVVVVFYIVPTLWFFTVLKWRFDWLKAKAVVKPGPIIQPRYVASKVVYILCF